MPPRKRLAKSAVSKRPARQAEPKQLGKKIRKAAAEKLPEKKRSTSRDKGKKDSGRRVTESKSRKETSKKERAKAKKKEEASGSVSLLWRKLMLRQSVARRRIS